MKLYILYEKVDIEFAGKLILSKYIINRSKEINQVVLGHYRELIPEILMSIFPEKIIVLFKDIYKTSESLIDLFNLKGIKYLAFHEEEHRIFNFQNTNKFYDDLISLEYIKKIGFLTLSHKTKEYFLRRFPYMQNGCIAIIGNPKYDFMKLIKKNFKKKIFIKKYILFALTESFFKTFRFYYYVKKKKLNLNSIHTINFSQYNLKEMYCQFIYIKQKLKYLIKIAKSNPNEIFLLRPHPSDKENLFKLIKLFKNQKNINVELEGDIYNCILNSKLVISGPSSTIIDSLILEKPFLIFYDYENKFHRFPYGMHPTTKFKEKFVKFSNHSQNLNSEKFEISDNEKKLINNYTNYEINSYQKIYFLIDSLIKLKNKNFFFKKFCYKLLFEPVINQIIHIKNKNVYGHNAFKLFKKKVVFKIAKFLPYIFFKDNSSKNYFFRHIFKLILGTSDNKISDKIFHTGELEKINYRTYNSINKILKENIFFCDLSNTKLYKNGKKIILTKKT